jgi:hypothetical protein
LKVTWYIFSGAFEFAQLLDEDGVIRPDLEIFYDGIEATVIDPCKDKQMERRVDW